MSATERWIKLLQRTDALSLRERLFVFAALLVVIGGTWEAFLATPLEAREARATARIENTRTRLAELDQSLDLTSQGIGDGMSAHFTRLQALRQQVAAGEESVRIYTSDLVDPGQMRFVLEDLLREQTGLQLVSISNLPVEPVVEPEETATGAAPRAAANLFRHGLVLVLEGSYLDCFAYLRSVESLPWQLYWSSIELATDTHPRSRIMIELHTLSLEEEWIGV
jgi:MSHA biogenesis protein MshJ